MTHQRVTIMAGKAGGVDRTHGRSIGVKLGFAALHGLSVLICLWLAFGGWDWPDPMRAKVMAGAAVFIFCAIS